MRGLPHLIIVPTGGKGKCCDAWGMQVKGKFCKWHWSCMSSPPVYMWLSATCSLLMPSDYLQFWTTGFLKSHILSPADMSSSNPERKYLVSFFSRNNNSDFFIFPFTSNIDVDWHCKSNWIVANFSQRCWHCKSNWIVANFNQSCARLQLITVQCWRKLVSITVICGIKGKHSVERWENWFIPSLTKIMTTGKDWNKCIKNISIRFQDFCVSI